MEFIVTNAPGSSLAVAAGFFLLGIILWLFGGRALKVAFAMCFAAGAVVFVTMVPETIIPADMRWPAAGILAIIGIVTGIAALRFAVMGVLALTLTLAAPMMTAEYIKQWGSPFSGQAVTQTVGDTGAFNENMRFVEQGMDRAGFTSSTAEGGTQPDQEDTSWEAWFERVQIFGSRLRVELTEHWSDFEEQDSTLLILSGLFGFGFGVVLGVAAPKTAGIFVASGLGAAICLVSLTYTLTGAGLYTEWMPGTSTAWVSAWFGLAVVGGLIQRFFLAGGKKSDG